MYAIATVIYGIPLLNNKKSDREQRSLELQRLIGVRVDDEDDFDYDEVDAPDGFFIEEYGSGFGIQMGEFDEGCHHVDASSLKLIPTDAQVKKYNKLFSKLPLSIQQELTTKFGQPRTYFLWGHS